MSNNDDTKRKGLARKSGQLQDNYSQLEQNFSELKRQAALNETQGLVQAQDQGRKC